MNSACACIIIILFFLETTTEGEDAISTTRTLYCRPAILIKIIIPIHDDGALVVK